MKKPNIVWIISDDTSHKMLGYAGGNVLSPNIDSIAENGIEFTHFYCASVSCTPSRYNYLTGHYGGRCPAESFKNEFPDGEPCSVHFNTNIDPERETTLAEVLRENGYFTGFTGKWHTGPGSADTSFKKLLSPDADPQDPAIAAIMADQQKCMSEIISRTGFDYAKNIIWGNHETLMQKAKHHNIEYTAKGALNFIDRAITRDQPFFLNVATTTIHGPDQVESLLEEPRLTAGGYSDEHLDCMPPRSTIYRRIKEDPILDFNHITAGILWMDDCVGAIIERIRELGLEEDTIIIFSTDHGPVGGKFTLYDPGIRIPFVMQWKGHLEAGLKNDGLSQNIDLAPTLFKLAGVEPPETMQLDGKDLFQENASREELYFEYGYQRAIKYGKWKYIAWRMPERMLEEMKTDEELFYGLQGKPLEEAKIKPSVMTPCIPRFPHLFAPDQLYDLENDPDEVHNLVELPEYQSILAELKQRLQKYLDSFDNPFNVTEVPDDFYSSELFKNKVERIRRKYIEVHDLWMKHDARIYGFDKMVRPI